MADPKTRPGFSRSAQFLLFASYAATVLGALLGVLLLVTAWADPAGHAALRSRLTDATAPLSSGFAEGARAIGRVGKGMGDWWRAGRQNAELRAELDDSRVAMVDVVAVRAENDRLKRLLRMVEREGAPVATTRLVASSPASLRRFGVMPVGRSAGVGPDQTVRGPTGLAGRVVEAGAFSARVLLITDTSSVIPVRRATDDLTAVVVGDGTGGLELRPLANRRIVLRPGDLFVTSGIGGLFRPGIPIAVASGASTGAPVAARPLFDPGLGDIVLVLPVWSAEMAVDVRPPADPAPPPASAP